MMPNVRPPFWLSAARWLASILNSWAHFILLLSVAPFSRRAAWLIYRHWSRITARIFGITVSLRDDNAHESPPPPHLYVWLNQSSLTEGPLFSMLAPPHHYIINLEYAAMPLLGWARVLLGDIVIIRQWPGQAKRGIERAAQRLARGETWAISIEGTRSSDGKLSPYKKGPIVMALTSQATIIPTAFHGSRYIMPRGEWRIRPGHIEIHLLKAIPTRGLTYDDRGSVLTKLRAIAEREFGEHGAQQAVPGDGLASLGRA